MIKAIGLRKVNLSQEEFDYFQEIIKRYSDEKHSGADYFEDLFDTDKNGVITIIKANKNIPWEVLFFVQNLMINQNLRQFDSRIDEIEKKLELFGKIGSKDDK